MMRRRDKAFSMVEMMIVIFVIAILVTLITAALRGLLNSSRGKGTRALMESCRSMLSELNNANRLAGLPTGSLAAPGDVSPEGPDRLGSAVQQTRDVFTALRALPVNEQAMGKVAAEQLLRVGGSDTPVLLDAWGNPILYVPAGGLTGVTKSGSSVTITSPDGRPFWASAGADGYFNRGDDNVYSFDN